MSRIAKTFAELKKRREAALIAFITAGDPDLKTTLRIMRALEEGGADCIEVGIPFSDPTADGPTIQRSSERALKFAAKKARFSKRARTIAGLSAHLLSCPRKESSSRCNPRHPFRGHAGS